MQRKQNSPHSRTNPNCYGSLSAATLLPIATAGTRRGRGVPQKVVDVGLPTGVAGEIRRAAQPSRLEEARGVPFLQRNRQAAMPSPKNRRWAPLSERSQLRRARAGFVCSITEPIQRLFAPTTEGLHREGNQPPAWQRPSGVAPVFALSSSLSCGPVAVRCRPDPRGALGVAHHHVPVGERVGGGGPSKRQSSRACSTSHCPSAFCRALVQRGSYTSVPEVKPASRPTAANASRRE